MMGVGRLSVLVVGFILVSFLVVYFSSLSVTRGLFRGEVVKQKLLRQRKKGFLRRFLVNWIFPIAIHRRLVRKPHDHANVERRIHIRTGLLRQGLTDRKEFHFRN